MLANTTPDARAARVVGDNLAAARYGLGTGRYHHLHLCAQMDKGLRPLAETRWSITWQAVRRKLNVAADRLATLGAFWADRLRATGHAAVAMWTVWHHAQREHRPSTSSMGRAATS